MKFGMGSTLENCIQLAKLALDLITLICIIDAYDQNLLTLLAFFHNAHAARVRDIDPGTYGYFKLSPSYSSSQHSVEACD